jgi:PelA/Pel-15E family pectate lyase
MSRSGTPRLVALLSAALAAGSLRAQPAEPPSRDEALTALKRAAAFYRGKAASHGGYVYYYSPDLKDRWGEGRVSAETIFVQPPGTPTVGLAYLTAHAATGDRFYLDAAREAAGALVYGQLESGGWTQVIHFAPPERGRLGKYRKGKGGSWNASSLDDGQTQAALRLLVRTDRALDFKHPEIHESAGYGLAALLKAQFPNGAFPQVWVGPVEPRPVLRARFPEYDWKTEGKVKDYWNYYTLNDGLAGDVADALITAHGVYKDDQYSAALERLGDFLVLAQMPDPQPGWCQQYNFEMVPIWARKFEPPAVTGWESQDAMETLIRVARYTGKKKYLDPIPRALAYLKASLLPDGRVARYYEFKTNKPLYMDAQYRLTHDDSAAPAHYGWKQPARLGGIEAAYKAALAGDPPPSRRGDEELTEEVRRVLRELDDEGRWVSRYAGERLVGRPNFAPGFRYLSSAVFARNVEVLSEFIGSRRK